MKRHLLQRSALLAGAIGVTALAPTLREAVAGALEAVPAALREGASAEVEGALAAVGL